MYQFSYSQVLADDPTDARQHERRAFEHAIGLLAAAEGTEPGSPAELKALEFVNQLWAVLIKDLAHTGNDLPAEVRAGLMSIGLWVMSEAQRIETGQSRHFAAIAQVCGTIRDGLA